MNIIKSKLRSRVNDENLESCVKLKTTYKPDFRKGCKHTVRINKYVLIIKFNLIS